MDKRLREVISECQFELATNFDSPAILIISRHAARVGMDREVFDSMLNARVEVKDETSKVQMGAFEYLYTTEENQQ